MATKTVWRWTGWHAGPKVATNRCPPQNVWHQADRELATAWMALRRAVRHADAVQLHDGQVLLDLGGGVLADMQFRCFGEKTDKVEAALELGWSKLRLEWSMNAGNREAVVCKFAPLTARVDTYLAQTNGNYISSLGYAIPVGIHLTGQGMAVEIHFVASPLLAAAGPTHVAMAGVGAVVAVADDD